MFLFRHELECKIANTVCCSQLKYVESEIKVIEQSICEDNINRHYDEILLNLNMISGQLDIITIYKNTSKILSEINNLKERLNVIYDKIENSGTKIKNHVLSKLNEIDTFNKTNSEIKEVLEWVLDVLSLDNIELEDDIYYTHLNKFDKTNIEFGKIMNASIYRRQINSYESCIKHAISKKINEAIHSLTEFIDNYQYTIKKPFNSYERISIRTMIKVITINM